MVRDPFTLIFSLVQPLVFLGLFAPLLVGSSGQPVGETPAVVRPGRARDDRAVRHGRDRLEPAVRDDDGLARADPRGALARSSLLVGRALKEIAPIVVRALIIVLIAWPFGFTINVPGLVIGLALLAVFGVGLGSLSYTARAEDEGPRVAVLGRAADADLPAADPLGDACCRSMRGPRGCGRSPP